MKKPQNSNAGDKKPQPNTSIAEVYELSLTLLNRQRSVINSLDGRVATYIGLFGVAVTIFISFGGLLIEKIRNLPGMPIFAYTEQILSPLYMLATFFLGAALYCALRAYHFGRVPPLEEQEGPIRKITIRLLRKLVGNDLRTVEIDSEFLPKWVEEKAEEFKKEWGQHFLQVHTDNQRVLAKRMDYLNKAFLHTFFAILTLGVLVAFIALYIWFRGNNPL